jgi:hypothetical protein
MPLLKILAKIIHSRNGDDESLCLIHAFVDYTQQ